MKKANRVNRTRTKALAIILTALLVAGSLSSVVLAAETDQNGATTSFQEAVKQQEEENTVAEETTIEEDTSEENALEEENSAEKTSEENNSKENDPEEEVIEEENAEDERSEEDASDNNSKDDLPNEDTTAEEAPKEMIFEEEISEEEIQPAGITIEESSQEPASENVEVEGNEPDTGEEDANELEIGNLAEGNETIEEPVTEEAANDIKNTSYYTSGALTMNVNETKYLTITIPTGEALMKAAWSKNSPDVDIDFYGSNCSKTCKVTALSYSKLTPVVVSCTYVTSLIYNGRLINLTHYEDFQISINQNGGSGSGSGGVTGSYTIQSSSSSVNVDMANGYASLVITSGVNLSDTVFIEDDSAKGNYVTVSRDSISGNKAYYTIYPNGKGPQTIKFQLIYLQSANYRVIKDSITVRCNVICSHRYDNGVITKEPTATTTGVMTYTCQSCGERKTETIPAGRINISKCTVSLAATSYTYTGTALKPAITVKNGTRILSAGTDYTVSYSNNVNVGTGSVLVTGKGNYEGTVAKTFTIRKAAQNLTATVPFSSITAGKTLQITASGKGTISYSSGNTTVATVSATGLVTGKSAGTTVITISAAGNSNYNSASKTVTITVTKPLNASISLSSDSIILKKNESKTITVYAYGELPVHFNFSFYNGGSSCFDAKWTGEWKKNGQTFSHDLTITSKNIGTGTVSVYLKDTDRGEVVKSARITVDVKKGFNSSNVSLYATSLIYNGRAREPGVTVTVDGKKLKRDKDYVVAYGNNNVNVGTVCVIVAGKGEYTGVGVKTFKINKASQSLRLSSSSYLYSKASVNRSSIWVPVYTYNSIGTVRYSSNSKYITIRNGNVFVKKGAPKGNYKVVVTAAGNENYKACYKTVMVRVR